MSDVQKPKHAQKGKPATPPAAAALLDTPTLEDDPFAQLGGESAEEALIQPDLAEDKSPLAAAALVDDETEEEHSDAFAQLAIQTENVTLEDSQIEAASVPLPAVALFGETIGDESDPFAEIAGEGSEADMAEAHNVDDAMAPPTAEQPPALEQEIDLTLDESLPEVDATLAIPASPRDVPPAARSPAVDIDSSKPNDPSAPLPKLSLADKDFSDLLAEFEDIEEDPAGDNAATSTIPIPVVALENLFGQDAESTEFDIMLSNDPTPIHSTSHSSPAPDLSIEHSIEENHEGKPREASFKGMFEDEPDWLEGTAVEQASQVPEQADRLPQAGAQELVVPEGWYDENEEFHYYTPEEREQVRETMIAGQADWAQPEVSMQEKVRTLSHAPAFQTGYSENAARRTPIPQEVQSELLPPNDPYAPQTTLQTPTTASSFMSSEYTSSSAGSVDPYAPPPSGNPYGALSRNATTAPSPYTPATASYDPYAPSPSSYSSPYAAGPTNRGTPSSIPASAKADALRPAPPQRVASTAYDPPFLRTQKSFAIARPVSAAPPPMPFPLVASTPPPPPPAPPPGPPRRPKSTAVPDMPMAPPPRPPSVNLPPAPPARPPSTGFGGDPYARQAHGIPRPPSALYEQESRNYEFDDYAPRGPAVNEQPPPASNRTPSSLSARPPAPRAPSHNAFDPPLRPSSAAASRAPAPRQTAPPPMPPPVLAISPPPAPPPAPAPFPGPPPGRPASRGAPPPRKAMPAFVPPPAAPPPRMRPSPAVTPVEPPRWDDEREEMHEDERMTSTGTPHRPSERDQISDEREEERGQNIQDYSAGAGHYGRFDATPQRGNGEEPAVIDLGNDLPDFPKQASYGHEDHQPYQQQESAYSPSAAYQQDPVEQDQNSYDPRGHRQQSSHSSSSYNPDPYGPSSTLSPPQSSSSLGLTMGSKNEQYDPYAPTTGDQQHTNGYSPYSPSTREQPSLPVPIQPPSRPSAYDPYAPTSSSSSYQPGHSPHTRTLSPPSGSDYGTSLSAQSHLMPPMQNSGPADDTYVPQQVLEQRPISEDPLGRCTTAGRNIPLAIFGFGGVLITAFPASADVDNETRGHARTPSYGYASGRGQLWIRKISDIVSTSALKSNDAVFPGPLILDTSAPKSAAGDKKKKEAVLEYLRARGEEIEKGLPYLKSSASAARREEEGKLVLVRILAAMIIGEGRLSGSAQVEDALRTALQDPLSPMPTSSTFSPATAKASDPSINFSTSLYPTKGASVKASTASASHLAQLSTMLQNGDKRDAVIYASSNGLWSHALVISSSVDQDLWKETVLKFSTAELAGEGLAGIKASYAIFSGSTLTSVDDLVSAAQLQDPKSSDQWREVIAAVVFSGKPTDLACLDLLSTKFRDAGLVNAAHACSLLSPSSPFSNVTPGAFDRAIELTQSGNDEDAIIFAEIAEYARTLITVPKGQELSFPGLPQLLPFKLHRAWWAAELGDQELAKRYCNAVGSASKPGKNAPSILARPTLNSLEDLLERITGDPSTPTANAIGGRKSAAGGKPGFDKLGSWIGGRLTTFIAGEEEVEPQVKAPPPKKDQGGGVIGPFSHFSTISPAPSNPVTRAGSSADVVGGFNMGASLDSRGDSPDYGANANDNSYSYGYTAPGDGEEGQDDTPHALYPTSTEDSGELLNPMAALSLGPSSASSQNYDYGPTSSAAPKGNHVEQELDDEDDLGFGNTALSRNRTPQPPADGKDASKGKAAAAPKKDDKAQASPASGSSNDASLGKGAEPKTGWIRGWFGGKKEGTTTSGPIRAKLGEENAMVYDPDQKRWVVKGAKAEPAAAPPPPPPRSQTVSPSRLNRDGATPPTGGAGGGNRAASATPPPPSQLSRSLGPSSGSRPPGAGPSRPSVASLGFTESPDGAIRRQKSSLDQSVTPDSASASATPPMSAMGPPSSGPPSRPPASRTASGAGSPAGTSIDDLLSRPPPKRPASAAKKPMRSRYVDVLQPGSEK